MLNKNDYIISYDPASNDSDYSTLLIFKKCKDGTFKIVDSEYENKDPVDKMYNKWKQLMINVFNRQV